MLRIKISELSPTLASHLGEVARLRRDGGREKIINLTIIFITVPWDAEDVVPYNLSKIRQIKAAGASPRPTLIVLRQREANEQVQG